MIQPIKNKAIVLGLGVNGLGIIRSLSMQGIEVIGVYTVVGPGVYSKHCKPVKLSPIEDEQKFLGELLHICELEALPPVLFPTSDNYVKFISKYRDVLNNVSLFNVPEHNLLKRILSKKGVQELAQRHNVNSPRTCRLDDDNDLASLLKKLNYPCIFKPADYRLVLPDGLKCYVFNSEHEVKDFVELTEYDLTLGVFQELIFSGDEYSYSCSGYIDKQFKIQSLFCAKKIRQYYPDFGIMCYGESVKNQEITDIAKKILADISFTGIFDIDFLQDQNSLEYFLIEINPRSFYYNSFVSSCGVNVMFQMYQDLTIERYASIELSDYKEGVKWIDFESDLGSFFRKRKTGNICTVQWLLSLLDARSFAVFDKSDLMPFWYNSKKIIKMLLRKLAYHSV